MGLLERLGRSLPEAGSVHVVAAERATAASGPVGAFRFEPPWRGEVSGVAVSLQHAVTPLGGCRVLWVDLTLARPLATTAVGRRLRDGGFDARDRPLAPTSSAEADELFRDAGLDHRPLAFDVAGRPGGVTLVIVAPPGQGCPGDLR